MASPIRSSKAAGEGPAAENDLHEPPRPTGGIDSAFEPFHLAEEGFDPGAGDSADAARRNGGVAELLRKAMVAGLGAVFMTEEGIRTLVKDMTLPKDLMGLLVGQAEKSKSDLLRVVGEEMRRFLASAALRRELVKLLSDVTIEIKAEVRLRPHGAPEVRVEEATARRTSRRSPRGRGRSAEGT